MTPEEVQAEIDLGGSTEVTLPDGNLETLQNPPVPIEMLIPRRDNPRKNDIAAKQLAKTILEVGWGAPVLVQKETGLVIGGHTRLKAAKELGLKRLPVRLVDVDDRRAKAMALADNRVGELAEWDWAGLASDLSEFGLEEVEALGFDSKYLEKLADKVDGFGPLESDGDPEAGEPPLNPVTKPGDLWQLGDHYLLCGDSRDEESVAKLVGNRQVNVAFTSPPYASQRDYDESSGFKPIPEAEYVAWFAAIAANVQEHLAEDGSWFVNIKPKSETLDTNLYVMDLVIAHARDWGWHFATEFCWERTGIPGKVSRRFKNMFEPIYQFSLGPWKMRPESVRRPSDNIPVSQRGSAIFGAMKDWQGTSDREGPAIESGFAYPGNRLPTFAGSHEATGHAAAFPVGLPRFFFKAYSDKGDVVFDPFQGSGSSLLAAEHEERVGLGMELSPAYCDVIVQRWEELSGKKGERL